MHQIWLPILVVLKGHYIAELQLQVADAPMLQASCCSNAVLTLPTPQPLAGHSSIVNYCQVPAAINN